MSSGCVKQIKKPLDYEIYKKWLILRDMPTTPKAELPENGFYVEIDDVPIAAGFLRRCEGNHGMIDSVVTNPYANPEKRNQAMNNLIELILSQAIKEGMKVVLAVTFDRNSIERAKYYGFQEIPHKTFVKSLIERY